jgi:hypothetical protein
MLRVDRLCNEQVRLSGGGEGTGRAMEGPIQQTIVDTCTTEDLFNGDSKGKAIVQSMTFSTARSCPSRRSTL